MNVEEQYTFKPQAKKKLAIIAIVGVALMILGMLTTGSGGHEEEHAANAISNSVASISKDINVDVAVADEGSEHAETAPWLKRLFVDIWINNIYFIGIAIIGVFFVAFQYAAQAGWSAVVKRIPESFGYWLPIGGILTLVMFFVAGHDIFHWTHSDLFVEGGDQYDAIIAGKQSYFYWPLDPTGGFPFFFLLRMVLYFGLWYWLFKKIRSYSLKEDLEGGESWWFKMRSTSAIFLIVFAVTSSTAAWDWIMSIDTHWFSTMFGWYTFASWFVTGLATITLIVVYLKDSGYLSFVNSNHLHDLGKFIWAFSIFWTYIWFGQFLLIYYANIPEESVYFVERITSSNYAWVFYVNLILNFFLPFLLLMTRDAKRQVMFLKLVCSILIVGHWFDFYLMITPGTMNNNGTFGFLEIGSFMLFTAGFLFIVLSNLAKVPLVAKNHPMLEESLHHHI